MNIIAALILLLHMTLCIAMVMGYRKIKIHTARFYGQIEKLVMANNIDRAIKLCNAVPEAWATQTMKQLLLLANRPHELELSFQETLLKHNTGNYKKNFLMRELASNVATLVSWILILVTVMVYEHDWFTTVCVMATICFYFAIRSVIYWARRHLEEVVKYSLRLKNLLLNKAGYVPPQYRPVPMTEEEVVKWREQMNTFMEETVPEARKAGDTRPAHQLYDEKADANGVLPEL